LAAQVSGLVESFIRATPNANIWELQWARAIRANATRGAMRILRQRHVIEKVGYSGMQI
jgi:predicted transcriptional regulator